MPEADLNQYYSAGYFLIRATDSGWDLPKGTCPDPIMSLSQCVCSRFELAWGWNPPFPQKAVDFGIPMNEYEAFAAWCQGNSEIGWPGMFYSLGAARRAVTRFRIVSENLFLIGVGFSRDMEAAGWRGSGSHAQDDAVSQQIAQNVPLELCGDVLGHEVVSFEFGDFGHSWLCSGIHKEPFGFSLNSRGLINNYQDARRVYDWIAEDDMQGSRAEPEPYYIWLLVSYSLCVEKSD